MAIGLGTGPDSAVLSALANTTTTKSATFVGDTPGIVGYGGNVIVGSRGATVVVAVAAIILAAGACVVDSLVDSVLSVAALSISTVSVFWPSVSAVAVCTASAAVSSVAGVDGFSLVSVAAVGSAVG